MQKNNHIHIYALLVFSVIFLCCNKDEDKNANGDNNNGNGAVTIPNCGTVTDIDGNTYETVLIGNRCWLRENLKTTTLKDGTPLDFINNSADWDTISSNDGSPSYCWYNDDYNTYGKVFGALYNYQAPGTGKLCPQGWRFPDNNDWLELFEGIAAMGYSEPYSVTPFKVAKAMAANAYWESSTKPGAPGNDLSTNNKSGFSALPGGFRHQDGSFYHNGLSTRWWSRIYATANVANVSFISFNENSPVFLEMQRKNRGMSVRCVKDH